MDTAIIVAIIGAAGVVLGAALKTVAPELRLLVTGRVRANADLLSRWNCTWSFRPKSDRESPIDDVVVISKVRGEEFWGEGINTKYGGD